MNTISKIKPIVIIFYLFFTPFLSNSYSQENSNLNNIPISETTKKSINNKSKNVNVDARLLYGQYNNIDSSLSITQNHESFVYQLNSNLNRSNDFGYWNSGYYESDIGFTGKADITEKWKLTPELELNNESHGMYDNLTFSREEKDKIIINLKNEYVPAPFRLHFNFGGARYVHRLVSASTSDVSKSSFNKINEEIGWEWILSASNKFGIKHNFSQYYYFANGLENDQHINNDIFFSFKVTEYIKVGMDWIIDWNRDLDKYNGWFTSGRANISSVSLKNILLELSYEYDLKPFKPEDFYFEQKFISSNYDLPPAKVHNVNISGELDLRFNNKGDFYIKKFKIKGKGSYIKNNNFYNHYSLSSNILSAETVEVDNYYFKADFITDFRIFQNRLLFNIGYIYNGFSADRNITYRPKNVISGIITFSGSYWEIEWDNKYVGKVFINPDPDDDSTLKKAVIGSFSLQLKVIETFFIFTKINNLYNNKYSYRDGYLEPGLTILGGLRIII